MSGYFLCFSAETCAYYYWNMRIYLPFILCVVLAAASGCRSSHETKDSPQAASQTQTPNNMPKSPIAAVSQNISSVEAVVENNQDLGATQFTMKIFVIASVPVNGRTSIVEAGERIFVSPQYYADSTGKVNFQEPRNKRIVALKQLKTGESFKGKVAINRQGSWNIVDVDESK